MCKEKNFYTKKFKEILLTKNYSNGNIIMKKTKEKEKNMNRRSAKAVERERESESDSFDNIVCMNNKKGNIGLSGIYYDTG
mgnify:CR=1 FL=1